MQSQHSGFSLIELMVVITIIGILSAIAIPTYQVYTQRARFVEVVNAVAIYKTAIALALQEGLTKNELNSGSNGIPEPPTATKNLSSLEVKEGVITATGSSLVKNATYILTPNDDGTEWTVSGSCLDNGLCHAT